MAYATLNRKPELAKLRAAVPKNIIATWDDHDYCRNDAGSSCKWANESQRQFLQFWRSGDGAGGGGGGGDAVAARGGRLGVYEAYTYNVPPRERCRSPPCRRGSAVRVEEQSQLVSVNRASCLVERASPHSPACSGSTSSDVAVNGTRDVSKRIPGAGVELISVV